MGTAWILRDTGQRHLGGLDWHGRRSYLLFLGRRFPKATRRLSYTQNAVIFVSRSLYLTHRMILIPNVSFLSQTKTIQ